MTKKRGQNEGTIFEERPGRWIALITTGYEFRDGKRRRIRKKFVATTRAEVHEKLTDNLRKQQRGVNIAPTKRTLGTFLANWLEDTVKPTVRPKTYRSYEQMVRNHLGKTVPRRMEGREARQRHRTEQPQTEESISRGPRALFQRQADGRQLTRTRPLPSNCSPNRAE